MAALSKNKYDVYKWIGDVISTCGTNNTKIKNKYESLSQQLRCCNRLAQLFLDMYNDKFLYTNLSNKLQEKIARFDTANLNII